MIIEDCMKKRNIKDYAVRLLLGILILYMLFIGTKFLTRQILIEKLGMDNALTRLFFPIENSKEPDEDSQKQEESYEKVNIDWLSLYPYQNGGPILEEEEGNALTAFSDKIKAGEAALEEYTNVMLPGYQKYVEIEKKLEGMIGWNITSYFDYDSVASLPDGYLTTFSRENDVTYPAESIVMLNQFLQEKKIPFLYVQAPFKVSEKQDTSVSGKLDYSNQNANALLKILRENNVECLDTREYLNASFENYHEAFYRTDHHWKPQTGLMVSRQILEELQSRFGLDSRALLLDSALFQIENYPEFFLGSWGKRVTLSATAPEDFELLYPKYDTEFRVLIPERNMDVTGDFSILYNKSLLLEKDYYNSNPYEAYIWGNNAVMTIENKMAENPTKILIIKDSFGNCVAPFLACGVKKVDVVDVRHFSGSLEAYVEETGPDVVILLYNAAMLDDLSKGYLAPFNLK